MKCGNQSKLFWKTNTVQQTNVGLPKDINSTDLNIFFSSVGNDICESFKDKTRKHRFIKAKELKQSLVILGQFLSSGIFLRILKNLSITMAYRDL